MTREEYLKGKIKEYGMTQREFAANIGDAFFNIVFHIA